MVTKKQYSPKQIQQKSGAPKRPSKYTKSFDVQRALAEQINKSAGKIDPRSCDE